jgi:hypothetical protein
MGAPLDEEDRTARFIVPEDDLALLYVRGEFAGGSGTADLQLYLDRQATREINKKTTILFTWLAVGDTKQVHTRVTRDEREAWSFLKGDELVFAWTNPDSGNLTWFIEIGLVRLDANELR